MKPAVFDKPRKKMQKSYASGGYDFGTGKPCPTCYAPMQQTSPFEKRSMWFCPKHGAPSKP